jgi:hypothetical protein
LAEHYFLNFPNKNVHQKLLLIFFVLSRSLPWSADFQQRPLDGHPMGLLQGLQCGCSGGWVVVLLHLLLLRQTRLRKEEETHR